MSPGRFPAINGFNPDTLSHAKRNNRLSSKYYAIKQNKKIEAGQKCTAKESFTPLSDCYLEKQIHLPELTFSLSLPPRQSWITNHNKQ